ncbi:MAG TPA: sugar transferase [Chlamydiales bacterium]|nr:sugar transferase [Chlamydiales bacterium]
MVKRIFDILFSFFVLIFGLPIFILCAAAVKLSSPGPIFYAHGRIGKEGKEFGCLKFRTMHLDADVKLQAMLANNPELMQEWRTYYKLKSDPRITSFGKWLRKTSLDELPQFINVFKGDMSLVGPRPLTQDEVLHYLKEKASKILSVRPGLTSLWIVKGRNHFTLAERIKLEEFYVDHRTFCFDLALIFQTAIRMIFPKGAY